MFKTMKLMLAGCCLAFSANVMAAEITVQMHMTAQDGVGKSVGTVTIQETKYGLLLTPHLTDLSPGLHGFHIHEKPDCKDKGMAAGGHMDPAKTDKHMGPYSDEGHLGDLPAIYVAADGTATLPVLAPRLRHLSEVKKHALMLHEGGDNYSDIPAKLGGGAGRMVCGNIE